MVVRGGMKISNTLRKQNRCLFYSSKRSYFYEIKHTHYFYDRAHVFRDVPVDKPKGDGYNSLKDIQRWCDGEFISHYNKDPIWWNRTQIRGKRFVECELWENGEKERFLSLGLSKEIEDEVCAMFQSLQEEKGRPADLAERIKLAYQGELEIDDSSPPLPPIDENDYDALRVKFRYFARASGGNTAAMIFDCGTSATRKKMDYIFKQFPLVAQVDFDVLSFVAALEVACGPSVSFTFGRTDGVEFQKAIPDPETQSPEQMRALFPPTTMDDNQLVALAGLNNIRETGIVDTAYFSNALKSKNALSSDPSFKDIAEKFCVSSDFFQANLHDAVTIMTRLGVPQRSWCAEYDKIWS